MQKLKKIVALLLLATGALHLNAAVFENDWCKTEAPDSAVPGEPIVVTVTLKKDPGAQKLSVHLHWLKTGSGAFGGMLAWHPHRDAKVGTPVKFTFKANIDPAKMLSVIPLVFLSPDGDFKNATLKANPPKMDVFASAEKVAELAAKKRPATATFKRSYIVIEPTEGTHRSGDTFEVKVRYYLDPKDNWGAGTKLRLMPLGPWIDNPDGKFNKSRTHISYPGISTKTADVKPGAGEHVFTFKLGKTFQYNDLSWMAKFVGADGKEWPWSTRGGSVSIARSNPHFDVSVKADGGLFKYGETPTVFVTGDTSKEIAITLVDVNASDILNGKLVGGKWVGDAGVSAKQTDSGIALAFDKLDVRGTFAVIAKAEGRGSRHAYFATIPDVKKALAGRKTPFGVTNLGGEIYNRVAESLGMSYVRHFVTWSTIEPLPGQWNLDRLDKTFALNRAHGMDPWMCLYNPPPWVMPDGVHNTRFCPFPFDEAAWQRTAAHLAKHYRGKLWGFEWLNEIVPGSMVADPVQNYVDFCRIGTAEVRKHAPEMKIQAAGGLWPHNYRIDLLNAGLGNHIDVLPIHYGSGAGVATAQKDLAARGLAEKVTVWDNETARGMSVWEVPPRDALPLSIGQCAFVMRQWPDELTAGSDAIIYFGGTGAAAGNWSYLLDAHTPRPVAVSLALLSAKIGGAKPVGKFTIEPGLVFWLFDDNGKAVLVAALQTDDKMIFNLRTGNTKLTITDYQGNETHVSVTDDGYAGLRLSHMPIFVEGANLEILKEYLVLSMDTQISVLESEDDRVEIPVMLRNPFDREIHVRVTIGEVMDGAKKAAIAKEKHFDPQARIVEFLVAENDTFLLKPGETREERIVVKTGSGSKEAMLRFGEPTRTVTKGDKSTLTINGMKFEDSSHIAKPFTLHITSLKDLGNLLKNGDFEDSGTKLTSWNGNAVAHPADGLGLGLGKTVMRFNGTDSWQHESQGVNLPVPGATYLYTAWVWSDNMSAGSNLSTTDASGKSQTFTTPHVFSAGNGTKYWRFLAHRRTVPDTVAKMSVTPVAKGKGWAMYDNVRVTKYEGTDFMAEAARTAKAPALDGAFADWRNGSPIPLMCDNQVTAHAATYTWTPENLAGVAWFAWDAEHLYLGVEVVDDKHDASATNEQTDTRDSLTVAINPAPGTVDASRAFEWKISAAHPGGGSGKHTLFRSPDRAGRMTAGHLAKDSSLYGISVTRDESAKRTEYRIRIPWSEMDGVRATPGSKFGCTIKLNDSDGGGSAASLGGSMLWGGGIVPNWVPADFGLITLTE